MSSLISINEAVEFSVGNLLAIGDFDGNGSVDLAAEEIVSNSRLNEVEQVAHSRVAVFLTPGGNVRGNQDFAVADIVIEPLEPGFADADVAGPTHVSIGSIVDIDGDVHLLEALSSDLRFYGGRELVATDGGQTPGGVLSHEMKRYVFDLAVPKPWTTSNDLGDALVELSSVPKYEGIFENEGLSTLASVADMNGDGHEDFLVSGGQSSYLVLGPVRLSGTRLIDDAAAGIVDYSSLGQPISGLIRPNTVGEQPNAIGFVATDGIDAVVRIIVESSQLSRDLMAASVETEITLTGAANSRFAWLNYDGGDTNDLLVSTPTGAKVYSGEALLTGQISLLTEITPDTTDRRDAATRLLGLTAVAEWIDSTDLQGIPVGDVNGDGLDDLLFIDSQFLAFDVDAGIPEYRTQLLDSHSDGRHDGRPNHGC